MSESIPDDIMKTAAAITEEYAVWLVFLERAELTQAIALALFSERRRQHEQETSSEFERLLAK